MFSSHITLCFKQCIIYWGKQIIPKCGHLKIANIYYLTVSGDQGSEHSLPASSGWGSLTGSNHHIGWAYNLLQACMGRICLQAHSQLWAGLRSLLPAVGRAPCQMGFSVGLFTRHGSSLLTNRMIHRRRELVSKWESTQNINLISEGPCHHFC